MAETQTDGYPWEVTRLGTETWAQVRCVECRFRIEGKPNLEESAISHVRQMGHSVVYEHGTTRGWAPLATVPVRSERAGTETPAGKET